jgi:hypothetical protein
MTIESTIARCISERHRISMAEVHQLILMQGIEETRRQVVTKHERAVIEAAYRVLSDDAERRGFTYSGSG